MCQHLRSVFQYPARPGCHVDVSEMCFEGIIRNGGGGGMLQKDSLVVFRAAPGIGKCCRSFCCSHRSCLDQYHDHFCLLGSSSKGFGERYAAFWIT